MDGFNPSDYNADDLIKALSRPPKADEKLTADWTEEQIVMAMVNGIIDITTMTMNIMTAKTALRQLAVETEGRVPADMEEARLQILTITAPK